MSFKLYGTPGSLYTAKVRSYLIKQRIDFEERAAGEVRFRQEIVPKIGRFIIPVIETPDGEIVQDGADIIDWFEARALARWPALPTTPRHRLIALIFEMFGGEGLLRPAMHYRWNFEAANAAFLAQDFSGALQPGAAPEARVAGFADASLRMRKAMRAFGVTPQTTPLIEAAYLEFLDLFEAHLAGSPYLLGGRPTLADYGLIAPLYAHLGRDPHPSLLMKQRAHRVWRWVERMQRADLDAGEYGSPDCALFQGDTVPETLTALLRFVADDYLPEIVAHVEHANAWLDLRPDLRPGTNGLDRPGDRSIGRTSFAWRGTELEVAVMPYRLYLLQKVQDAVADEPEGGVARTLLADAGLGSLASLRTRRRVERNHHLEVWGHLAGQRSEQVGR